MSSQQSPGEAAPGTVSDMKVEEMLKETCCHFTWDMEKYYDVNIPRDMEWFAEEHEQFVKDYPKAAVSVYLLLSYLFTTGGGQEKDIDLNKAKFYVDKVLHREEEVCGETMVATGNKMHILVKRGEYEDIKDLYGKYKKCDEMLDREEKWHNPGDKRNKSAIKLIQGYAFTIYDVQAIEQAIQFYTEATELQSSADAYYRLGYAIDRKNRLIKPHGRSKDRAIKALKKACKLSKWTEPVYIVTYGLAKVACYDDKDADKSTKYLDECLEILAKATEVDCTESHYINKWAHRAYRRLAAGVLSTTKKKKYWGLQHKYIEGMLGILKECNVTLHEAGKFYWENPLYRDVEKARKLLESCRNYIWADIDLIKLEGDLDKSIDKKRGFIPLISKYRNSKYCHAILYSEIGQILRGPGPVDGAFERFLDDILEETLCSKTDNAIKTAVESLEEMDSPDMMLQIGHVYYSTNKLHKAKCCYERAVRKAKTAEKKSLSKEIAVAKERITELWFLLKCPNYCIQNGHTMCENKPHIKRMVAESYFVIGKELVSSDKETAALYFMKSAELGLLDAGKKLFELWNVKCHKEPNPGFCVHKHLYEEGVQIYSSFIVDKSYWSKPVFEHRVPITWEDRMQGLEKAKDLHEEVVREHKRLKETLGEVACGENKLIDEEEQERLRGVLRSVDEEQNKAKDLLNQEQNESSDPVNGSTTGPSPLEKDISNRLDVIVWKLKTSEALLNRITAQKRRKTLLDKVYRLLVEQRECQLQDKLKDQVTEVRKVRFAVTTKWLTQVKDDEVESANKTDTKYQTVLKDREVPLRCSPLLLEAKNVLDGSWFLLTQFNGTPDKDVRSFPISDLPKCIPEEMPMNVDTNKYIDNNWDKTSKTLLKKKKYKCLRDYIITHQATYDVKYFFLPVFNGLVNVIKHQACVVDQATGDLLTYYYNLSHQACVFVEDVVIKLSKYWSGEVVTTGSGTNQPDLEDSDTERSNYYKYDVNKEEMARPGEAATTGIWTNQPDLKKKEKMAWDHFKIAEALKTTDKKLSEKLLFKSTEFGLMEAGKKLLKILEKQLEETKWLGKELLEKFALLLIYLEKETKKDEEVEKIIGKLKKTMQQASQCSGLVKRDNDDKQFTKMSEERFHLTKEMMKKELAPNVNKSFEVLKLARDQMNRCLKRFIIDHNLVDSETNIEFPILGRPTRKSTPTRSQENMNEAERELKNKYPYLQKLLHGEEYKHIVTFLCEHQPTYDSRYNFLPILLLDQNEEKWTQKLEKIEENASARKFYYDCAHSACFMVEEFKLSHLITSVVKQGALCRIIVPM